MSEPKNKISLPVGQPFNPFRLFTGIFIPEALVKCDLVSLGAKVIYGRLARYAGSNGVCNPATNTLAKEVGISERQAQRYLKELEDNKLIVRVPRLSKEKGQSTNSFQFIWHTIFDGGDISVTGGVTHVTPGGVTDMSPKESQSKENHTEEKKHRDTDCLPTNRKPRDSRAGVGADSACKQYPHLRKLLVQYMNPNEQEEIVPPKDRHIVDIMDAAEGASEHEVMKCITYLHNERGLRYGTKNGPRHYSWFVTVVADHFRKKREREDAATPCGYHEWEERNDTKEERERFEAMTESF